MSLASAVNFPLRQKPDARSGVEVGVRYRPSGVYASAGKRNVKLYRGSLSPSGSPPDRRDPEVEPIGSAYVRSRNSNCVGSKTMIMDSRHLSVALSIVTDRGSAGDATRQSPADVGAPNN
jgi:hypothetical protein